MSVQASVDDIIEESSKKERIIAAFHVSPSADKGEVADALDVSYEYLRQIWKDIDERDKSDWEKLRPGDLDTEPEPKLTAAVENRLRETDAVTEGTSVSGDVDGSVPASEIAEVQERVELLREQAEFSENSEAEFVALKVGSWLDDLIEDAQ